MQQQCGSDDGEREHRRIPAVNLPAVDLTSTDTAFGVFVGLGLSAAAGLRLFVPLLVASVASATGHLELAPEFDWIGTTPALVGFAVAAVLEVCAYLVPFLDNALDAFAAPAATVAGAVLTASTIVDVSPWLKWSLAIVAGGGIAGTIQLFTGATRLTSTATTGGLANPAVSTAEAGGSAGCRSSRSRRRCSACSRGAPRRPRTANARPARTAAPASLGGLM